jgi:hypothetical protein
MKTLTRCSQTLKLMAITYAVIVFSTSVFAQPNPKEYENNDVREAIERLEVLMSSTEQASRYEAPSVMEDEVRSAMQRLELLAEKTEIELRYEVPELEPVISAEYEVGDVDQKADSIPETHDFLTFFLHLGKK